MRLKLLFLFICCHAVLTFSQEKEEPNYIVELKEKIEQSTSDKEKLQLADDLSLRVYKDHSLAPDAFIPFSEQAQKLALEQSEYDIAAKHARFQISHYNNYVGQPEKGVEIFKEIEPFLEKLSDPKEVADLYIEAGDSQFYLENVEESTAFYDKAIKQAKANNIDKSHGTALLYKGANYVYSGDFAIGSQTLQQASTIFQEIKDTSNLIKVKSDLSILYSQNSFFEQAAAERAEIFELAGVDGAMPARCPDIHKVLVANQYYNAATDAKKQGKYQQQLENLEQSIEISNSSRMQKARRIPIQCSLIGCYLKLGRLQDAKTLMAETKQFAIDNELTSFKENLLEAEKFIAFEEGNYQKAKQLGEEFQAEVNGTSHFEAIRDGEEFLAKVYEKLGQTQKSLSHLKKYNHIKDSIENVQKANSLSYYQTLYETEKRDTKIRSQQSDIRLLKAKNKLRNRQLIFGLLGSLLSFGLIYLYRSRKFAKERAQQQKQFAQDLIRSTEQERKRISSDLHDSIGQSLLLIKNKILLNPSEVKNDISLVDDAIHEVRSISQSLHPYQFETLGLLKSLEHLISQFQANSDTFYSHDIEIETVDLPENVSIFVYRIMQEALNNVEKHANALACNLSVKKGSDKLEFQVKDNGCGFDLTENSKLLNSLGMKTLKERAQIIGGQLIIDSTKDQGTIVNLKIPYS